MFNIFFLKNSYVQLKMETSFQDINMVLDILKREQLQHGFKYIKYIWPIPFSFLSLSTPYILTQIKKKTKTAKSNKWRHKDITY